MRGCDGLTRNIRKNHEKVQENQVRKDQLLEVVPICLLMSSGLLGLPSGFPPGLHNDSSLLLILLTASASLPQVVTGSNPRKHGSEGFEPLSRTALPDVRAL